MASYISEHHGGGWRYSFHIPVELRPLCGGKRAYRRYFPRMPRKQAEMWARQYALDDAHELARLKELTPAEKEVLASGGGWDRIVNDPAYLNDVAVDETTGRTIIQTPDRTHQLRLRVAEKVEHRVQQSLPSTVLTVSWD